MRCLYYLAVFPPTFVVFRASQKCLGCGCAYRGPVGLRGRHGKAGWFSQRSSHESGAGWWSVYHASQLRHQTLLLRQIYGTVINWLWTVRATPATLSPRGRHGDQIRQSWLGEELKPSLHYFGSSTLYIPIQGGLTGKLFGSTLTILIACLFWEERKEQSLMWYLRKKWLRKYIFLGYGLQKMPCCWVFAPTKRILLKVSFSTFLQSIKFW